MLGNYYFSFEQNVSPAEFIKGNNLKEFLSYYKPYQEWSVFIDDLGPEYSAEFKNGYLFQIQKLNVNIQGIDLDEVKIFDTNKELVYPGGEEYKDPEIEEVYFPAGILKLLITEGVLKPE